MRTLLLQTIAFTLGCLVTASAQSWAQSPVDPGLLSLSAQLVSAMQEANSALDDLESVETVVQEIEAGKAPSSTTNKWDKLAEKYSRAAKSIREAPLPTAFDATKYAVSASQLASCDSRPAALQKLHDYLAELSNARQRGQDALVQIDKQLAGAAKARDALTYLISVHTKLLKVPIYGQVFTWDWFTLNTSVSQALGDVQSALKTQRKVISDETSKLDVYVGNLNSNLANLQSLRCDVLGLWDGTMSDGKLVLPFELWLIQDGTINCTFRFNHDDDRAGNCSGVVITGRHLTVTLNFGGVGPDQYLVGDATPDFQSLSGTFSVPATATTVANSGTWSVRWMHK